VRRRDRRRSGTIVPNHESALKSEAVSVDQPEAESLKSSEKTREPRSGLSVVDAVTDVGVLMTAPLQDAAMIAQQSVEANNGAFTFAGVNGICRREIHNPLA
jgi:hypothetical protein